MWKIAIGHVSSVSDSRLVSSAIWEVEVTMRKKAEGQEACVMTGGENSRYDVKCFPLSSS